MLLISNNLCEYQILQIVLCLRTIKALVYHHLAVFYVSINNCFQLYQDCTYMEVNFIPEVLPV